MKKQLRMGIIGLGERGYALMKKVLLTFDDVKITALCDAYAERTEKAAKDVIGKGDEKPFLTTDYKKVLERNDVDAVLVSTSWEMHIAVSCDAMKAGKIVAMEVGGANSEEDCWKLVRTYEETKTPFMFMENCCYDRSEMMITAMAKAGVFGRIMYGSGAYSHDLRGELGYGFECKHYRLRNYMLRNGENYPTHELGPIAKIMNINRGNRMESLVSVSSGAKGLKEFINGNEKLKSELGDIDIRQGDVVNTTIKCANGEIIQLCLCTTLPGFYNRDIVIRGTKGMYNQLINAVFLDEPHDAEYWTGYENAKMLFNNAEKYEEKYLPKCWKDITEEQIKSGHGGMDVILFRVFVDAAKSGSPMPIDVYDAAAWMSITYLSEKSVALGGAPVDIPDFTNGKWTYAIDPNMEAITDIKTDIKED